MEEEGRFDSMDRDPHEINRYLTLEQEQVFGEPQPLRSGNCVWINAGSCFFGTKKCLYVLLSCVFGLQSALYWGCILACVSYFQVWYFTPWMRYIQIQLHPLRKMYKITLATFYAPFVSSMAYFLQRIQVTYSMGYPRKRLDNFSYV